MKTRITLTIDPGVSHRAEELAMRKGLSLSTFVEKLLIEVSGTSEQPGQPSFSERWRGRMAMRPPQDDRAKRLHQKFGLEAE
jgi:hypothetical protein